MSKRISKEDLFFITNLLAALITVFSITKFGWPVAIGVMGLWVLSLTAFVIILLIVDTKRDYRYIREYYNIITRAKTNLSRNFRSINRNNRGD
jgi:hypothetical protein